MRSALREKLRNLLARFGFRVERVPKRMLEAPDCQLHPGFEYILAHYLQSKRDPSNFFFVQIGAFDGVSGDPLHAYVKRHGWQGILVEPQSRYFEELQRTYADCGGLSFLQVAVTDEPGEADLYTLEDPDAPDLPDWAPQIASFDLPTILRHRRAIPGLENRLRREVVRCVTMDEILRRAASHCETLDLIQIDVEGYDYRVLRQIDLEQFSPTILRYEHKHLTPAVQDAAVRWLAAHGYRILREVDDTLAYRPVASGLAEGSRDT